MVCNVHYSLCRWDVSLGHAVEMEPECREEVLVGYVGVYIYIYFIYIYMHREPRFIIANEGLL